MLPHSELHDSEELLKLSLLKLESRVELLINARRLRKRLSQAAPFKAASDVEKIPRATVPPAQNRAGISARYGKPEHAEPDAEVTGSFIAKFFRRIWEWLV